MEEIVVTVNEHSQAAARAAAQAKIPADAMLLAWFDRTTRAGGPSGPGEVSEAYLDTYSRSRGAKAKVVVNQRFVLFFAPDLV